MVSSGIYHNGDNRFCPVLCSTSADTDKPALNASTVAFIESLSGSFTLVGSGPLQKHDMPLFVNVWHVNKQY